ncbi:MAG TPA: D-alanyl-D-alanine carboxypeptidase/D-alanyl-D-alanine-endopeptidase [Longimicrobiaceae bacterium]|nr:D-alanyl-D-alanine carboxypeptidase/D-alanyl-D-alanine-endopeptidase [Longimicrobiaceae bacterium]
MPPRRLTLAVLGAAALLAASTGPIAAQGSGRFKVAIPLPPASHTARAASRAEPLAGRIDAVLARPELRRGRVGVEVWDPGARRVLYARDAEKLFVPASNLKLVVTATAAHLLGPAYRWRTSVYGTGPVSDGTLRGDVVLFGRGDPTLSARYGASRTAGLEALADSLRARGIRRVTGDVVGDQSWWDDDLVRGEWQSYDLLWWYGAPVGALGFNDNSIDFRIEPGTAVGQPARITWQPQSAFVQVENRTRTVARDQRQTLDLRRGPTPGSIVAYGETPLGAGLRTEAFAVDDPARYTATVFRDVLIARGIAVDGGVRVNSDPARAPSSSATALAERMSPALPEVVAPILLRSQNWIAEMLLKSVARERRGRGSWDAGLAAERDFLEREVGVDSTAFRLRDASGLAGENLITPHAFVQVLDYVRRTPGEALVKAGMPVAGSPGSLQARFPDLTGRVRAKTGYISNVDSLSGYVTLADGREIVFSIVVNGTGLSSARVRTAIDDVVRAIAAGA